ncbi:MAG: sporulation protein YqfD [Ruminococcus sp.]|nr:sporulation protein YqfD [Ruminococcus sp.]
MSLRIRRCMRIDAQGRELNKFMNAMHENRIECRGQYCRNNVLHGDVMRRDIKKLRLVAEEYGIILKTAAYDSVFERLSRYRKRIGLLVGMILAVFTAVCFSGVIETIEIQGNTTVSDQVILAALAELDIRTGTPLFRIDLHSCESRLPFMIDGVAWAGMHRTGSRVVVQIREEAPKPEKTKGRVPCNIVSSHDAEITSVLVRSGNAVHAVGDYVQEGTLLISGVYESENRHISVYHAMGEIRGIYSENVSFSAAFRSNEYSPTGRSDTKRTLRLFSIDIPLYFSVSKYRDYSSAYSENPLVLFGKKLPISIKRTEISETARTEKVYTADELREKLMERVDTYEKNFLGSGISVISRDITTTANDDSLTLNVSYRLEGSICRQQEIFIK